MKITVQDNNDVTITIESPNMTRDSLREILDISLGLSIRSREVKVTTSQFKSAIPDSSFNLNKVNELVGVDLRTCSSVHNLVMKVPGFITTLEPAGFRDLVDQLVTEGWLPYRPEDRSLHCYYNKAHRIATR